MDLSILQLIVTVISIIFVNVNCEFISIRLFVKSQNTTVDGMGLYSLHEGEGYNFFFLGEEEEAQQLIYDTRMYQIYFYYNYFVKYKFTICNYCLQLSYVHYPFKVKIKKNGDLKFTGSKKLYAAKNVKDPHSYSNQNYALYYCKDKKLIPPGAIEVTVTTRKTT